MFSECASLSYLPLEFVRFLRWKQCKAAERNRALGSKRPGLEPLLGHLLAAGPQASDLTSSDLTSINACIVDFFGSYACSLVPGNVESKVCLSYRYRTFSSYINLGMN